MRVVNRLLAVLLVWASLGCSDTPEKTSQYDVRLQSTSLAADEPTIECVGPVNYATYALQAGQPALDIDFEYATNVESELTAGTYSIGVFGDALAPLLITDNSATATVSLAYGEHTVTFSILDDELPLGGPSTHCSVVVRVTQSCFDDGDCADLDPCSTTTCGTGPGGEPQCVFGAPPYADCCTSDYECASGTVCDLEASLCVDCQSDSDCQDSNVCTSDVCQGGSCVYSPIENCCDCDATESGSAQCSTDTFCVEVSCNCGTNECEFIPKELPGGNVCCETGDDAACDDGDPCTNNVCVGNACTSLPVLDGSTACCNDDADCNDGSLCTVDACDAATNSCQHTLASSDGCCQADTDCDDGDPLTWDACVYYSCVSTENFQYCELPPSSAVVINELMINPASAPDATAEWVELHNRTEAPLDLTGWSLGQLGAGGATVGLGSGDSPLILPALGFVVLCRSDGALTGDRCDAVYGQGFALANEDDSVVLYDNAGLVHDQVAYDGGPNFPNPVGASIALGNPLFDNDLGSSWRISFSGITG
ncbi:MAG: lamin tail domain-containing protein, partial [Myxococcota bacterium]|nr:lamin tail domain-containing protein [Myxococcota bacterium]